MKQYNNADVIIVQKQTALERYTKPSLNIDFYDYLAQDNQVTQNLHSAHQTHVTSREYLLTALKALGLTYVIFNLDELSTSQVDFFDENIPSSGLCPQKKLVISLGGDGTLLHASHHVGAQIKLLGINSCPEHSVGHLCSTLPHTIENDVSRALSFSSQDVTPVRRRVDLPNSKPLPLALNDALVCHLHPAATSRYQLSVIDSQGQVLTNEKQLSSGLWVANAAGSTAAISTYGFESIPLQSSQIRVACREPYLPKKEDLKLGKFSIDSDTEHLSIFSRMRQGIVCLDGPDFCAQFGFSDTIKIHAPQSASLLLIQK
jgi:NAD+ kinase